jgi:hypothetical protein
MPEAWGVTNEKAGALAQASGPEKAKTRAISRSGLSCGGQSKQKKAAVMTHSGSFT